MSRFFSFQRRKSDNVKFLWIFKFYINLALLMSSFEFFIILVIELVNLLSNSFIFRFF